MSTPVMPTVEMPRPVVLPSPLQQVTDAELTRYAELIYGRTGVRVPPQKKTLLSNRLRRRLRETGIADFTAYYDHLKRLRPNDPEWDAFLREITTHETYLFRDEGQWQWFRESFLPGVAAEARAGRRLRRLRIWSAACSTGDEAFTAACCIAAGLPNHKDWTIRILGTDIGIGAVARATAGVFGERAMRLVPHVFRERFFSKEADAEAWRAGPALRSMTAFRQHNLMEPLREPPFDLVFLKNVLIYFDRHSKRRVLEHVRAAIRPGGLLVAGPADGVGELVRDYVRHQVWLFQRPQQ
jgi:chemotaxis protein methyltransferase CheR